ncbi:hypothetical protein F4811DRAFT_520496 [Daldinia bambusicola]|nr:hypothetical protein F4811DRAFT_520496 [Daldinia bambusicola]
MEVDHIDTLLERYLHLLHEYTTLREQLSSLQTGMYQNIARANFAAERGIRFGQDYYDERMQASRRVAITTPEGDGGRQDVPVFAVTAGSEPSSGTSEEDETIIDDSGVVKEDVASKEGGEEEEEEEEGEKREEKGKETPKLSQKQAQKDPLRWFGLLTPMPLRQAQAQSIQAVEQVIPRIVSVNAQMANVEIQVRRARKKRAKAKAEAAAATAAVKMEREGDVGTEIAV